MSNVFNNVLGSDESLFKNELALDFSFRPKLLEFRDNEQHYVANCIKPLFDNRSGRNLIIYGMPGVGKTLAILKVLEDLGEQTDEIIPIYVNCWKKDSSYKIVIDICEQIGYKFIQNRKTDELLKSIMPLLNKKKVVFVFDEVDRIDEFNILYNLLEDVYKKVVIVISNDKNWIKGVDERLKSRLLPDSIEFKAYSLKETEGILKQRVKYAFVRDILTSDVLKLIVEKTFSFNDMRVGLFLLREAANLAEQKSQKYISIDEANEAIGKLDLFKMKEADFDEGLLGVLDLVKGNSGRSVMNLYLLYKKDGGDKAYKTFYRRMKKLEKAGQVSLEEINKGSKGKSTLVYFGSIKKLDSFK